MADQNKGIFYGEQKRTVGEMKQTDQAAGKWQQVTIDFSFVSYWPRGWFKFPIPFTRHSKSNLKRGYPG